MQQQLGLVGAQVDTLLDYGLLDSDLRPLAV